MMAMGWVCSDLGKSMLGFMFRLDFTQSLRQFGSKICICSSEETDSKVYFT